MVSPILQPSPPTQAALHPLPGSGPPSHPSGSLPARLPDAPAQSRPVASLLSWRMLLGGVITAELAVTCLIIYLVSVFAKVWASPVYDSHLSRLSVAFSLCQHGAWLWQVLLMSERLLHGGSAHSREESAPWSLPWLLFLP